MSGINEVRIVLLGKTGAGKSSTGNTILGRNVFKAQFSPNSVTQSCGKQEGEVGGRRVTVVDTPGVFDTSLTEEKWKEEMRECVKFSVPGPHVFLLVIRLGRYIQEDKNAVRWIQERFGKEAVLYTMMLFTGGDELDKPVEEFVNADLKELMNSCGGGYHVLNNKNSKSHSQVTELLSKIDKAVERNGGGYYTNEMYKEAQRKVEEEEKNKKWQETKWNMVKYGGAVAVGAAAVCVGGFAAGQVGVTTAAKVGEGILSAVLAAGKLRP